MSLAISTSVFEIFKIGPGPSSSHTIGPMKAGLHFRKAALGISQKNEVTRISVSLWGSLGATGKGHGTDRSVLAGLMGWEPENCDPEKFLGLLREEGATYTIALDELDVPFSAKDIAFHCRPLEGAPFQNTLVIKLLSGDEVLLEKEYYSIGGGFIQCKGEQPIPNNPPKYPYRNMTQLRHILGEYGLTLPQLILENECAIAGASHEAVYARLDGIVAAMERSVSRGLSTQGVLPGPIHLERKALSFYERSSRMGEMANPALLYLNAYALAAAEENAAGSIVVTAPTSGSSGLIPSILYLLKNHFHKPNQDLRNGLLAAAAIGFIIKHNASIAGADVGCQGEIGAAASMGAALLACAEHQPINVIANAAEIALEHHLGLTCDPVGGYVQIPCIERNAVGAVAAYNAFLLAVAGDPDKQKVQFDQVVEAMLQTGRDMPLQYKETALGGLAKCSICC